MKSYVKSLIDIVHSILYVPTPLCHKYSILTFHGFYLKSKLEIILDIVNAKSRTNEKDLVINNNTLQQNQKPDTNLTSSIYVNLIRKMKHFPPSSKE